MGPPFKFIKVLLDSILFFYHIICTTQLGAISKLAEGALNYVIDVIDKDVKEHQSQDRCPGAAACYQPPPGHRTINHHPLSAAFQEVILYMSSHSQIRERMKGHQGQCRELDNI